MGQKAIRVLQSFTPFALAASKTIPLPEKPLSLFLVAGLPAIVAHLGTLPESLNWSALVNGDYSSAH